MSRLRSDESAPSNGIVTWLSNRKLIAAQTRQLEAATEHQRVQTDAIRQQADVTQQRTNNHADQLGTLHLVVAHMLSTHEQFFLKQLESNTDYAFEDKFREKDHLRRLRDLAFVSQKGDRHIADLHAGDRLSDALSITPAGKEFLKVLSTIGTRSESRAT